MRVDAQIGKSPGHWSSHRQDETNQFLPDSGFTPEIYSVPFLSDPSLLAFDLESIKCVRCRLMNDSAHQFRWDTRPHKKYDCSDTFSGRRAFFMASSESVMSALDPGWYDLGEQPPRFPCSTKSGKQVHFREWMTGYEVLPGKRLACGAWFEGAYPPLPEYSEIRGDTVAYGSYVIRDRAIYLVGKEDKPEYLWRERHPVNSYESTFELAFLPADHSEMENEKFSYVYRVPGGLWLRVDHSRD
ncbi:MAG TPA: hypothetical protein VN539_06530, partial [Candidatus Saccharimonadales bacterium]|nr:hypothetical protein [Candidatus Saccharimonadales bacterium]